MKALRAEFRKLHAKRDDLACGDEAAALGTGMRALRKDERKLTPGQRGTLAQIAATSKPLCKGYLIKIRSARHSRSRR